MLIMEYNITFTLGDPSGDGHACTSEYHIVANHSVDEISEAYKKTTKELGFDYVEEVGADYQAKRWIPEEYTTKLLELGIIDREFIEEDEDNGFCYMFDYAEEEFVFLFFDIVKHSLPDLEWDYRDLNERTLYELEGAAYGFAYHGE